ncbi:mucin-4 [Myxocyprinus asiaticus]|uniref:mucin-4 n=1 Tax=Myxocyprinus asiaticus TaxID=70543 RepID=UPI002221498C|nr:mucin-4 [Myxocyprinus asiaticus]
MEMTLLSITVWLTHFLFASALYFNTTTTQLSKNTLSDYTETTQITGTTTESNQEPRILINSTASSPQTTESLDSTVATALHMTSTEEIASMHQPNSRNESQNDIVHFTKGPDGWSVSNASNVMIHTITSLMDTTVSSNPGSLTIKKDDNNEIGTKSSAHITSYDSNRHTSLDKVLNTQTTRPVTMALLDTLKTVTTVPWRDWSGEGYERTKPDEGNYEMNSNQATSANLNKETRGTQVTEGSYSLTSEHRVPVHNEEQYNTTTSTTEVSTATPTTRNNWITPYNTNTPMTSMSAYKTEHDLTVTDTTEYHTSIPVLVTKSGGYWTGQPSREYITDSTTQSTYRLLNSTTHTERENRTETDTPSGITSNNSTIIANVIADNSTNATTDKMNNTSTENTLWPNCFNSQSQFRQSRLVCFITVWALAMTASVFLGISVFLWVRLSIVKKRMKHRGRGQEEKGGQKWEKESLWANPKASVQERVEFWYVNGSTLKEDRKEKQRKREERFKRKKQEQNKDENELWIQPRVTMDDLAEFWYANRRIKEERRTDMSL